MLGTGAFTGSAADAVGGPSAGFRVVVIVEPMGVDPFGQLLALGVIEGKVVGNGDVFRASFHTVAAGGAGNGDGAVDDGGYLV